ncbi:MAG: hypothetical protein WBV73_16470 [Phormidium sp.]
MVPLLRSLTLLAAISASALAMRASNLPDAKSDLIWRYVLTHRLRDRTFPIIFLIV